MNVQVGKKVISVDLVGDLTPQQYMNQLLSEDPGRRQVPVNASRRPSVSAENDKLCGFITCM